MTTISLLIEIIFSFLDFVCSYCKGQDLKKREGGIKENETGIFLCQAVRTKVNTCTHSNQCHPKNDVIVLCACLKKILISDCIN